MSLVFGPVPSRRLGRSLGVNNIPDKVCTYACVYCQIGTTLRMEIKRREFYEPQKIYKEVENRLREIDGKLDYITFVPDGEPTLDINLGKIAKMLRDFNVPIAILTNSSLLPHQDVHDDLMNFDFISFKLDAVSEDIWRRVDRPHKNLNLEKILNSLLDFRREFSGKVVTETMLIDGIDYGKEIPRMAEFLREFKPDVAYVAVPTRPPAEKWVKPANEYTINRVYIEFSNVTKAEFLIGYEGNEFSSTGNFVEDLMSITAVHPMREEAVLELMKKCNEAPDTLQKLIENGDIIVVEYQGKKYYMRSLPSRRIFQRDFE